MCSDTLDPGGEVRGYSAGCTIAISDVLPFVWVQLTGPCREFPKKKKKNIFDVCVLDSAGLYRVRISTKSLLCFRSILRVILKVMPHTAHRSHSLLSAARRSSSRRHLARSSTAHVESSDIMRSRKAQCQAPPDNPETGDTYHNRERRSCAGEKIEHLNEYKQHSSSSAGMYVYKRG